MKFLEGKGIYTYTYIFSKLSMKIFAYDGAYNVPIERHFIWRSCLQLNTMLFRVKTTAKNVGITFVATFLLVHFSDSFADFIPSAFGILVYRDLALRATK